MQQLRLSVRMSRHTSQFPYTKKRGLALKSSTPTSARGEGERSYLCGKKTRSPEFESGWCDHVLLYGEGPSHPQHHVYGLDRSRFLFPVLPHSETGPAAVRADRKLVLCGGNLHFACQQDYGLLQSRTPDPGPQRRPSGRL